MYKLITYSIEKLYHFKCSLCHKWWSIGDYDNRLLTCPFCGLKSGGYNLPPLSRRLHKRIWWQWSLPWYWVQLKQDIKMMNFYRTKPNYVLPIRYQ